LTGSEIVERARLIAEQVLFPSAIETDAADLLPRANLDALARAGFYGMAGPSEAGGLDLDLATAYRVVEALATGCLTTTFVWLQSQNPVRAVTTSRTPGLYDTCGWVHSAVATSGPASPSQGTDPARPS
jgi:alkylation response protein AidB-like acyl-CoA dehydrogenase